MDESNKMNTMEIDTKGRILGSFLIVTAYFVVLHISATIGALMHLIANVISLPFFIRTKAHDVVIMLTFLMVCLLYTSPSPRDRTRSRMPSSA